jgi:hypothetical protein
MLSLDGPRGTRPSLGGRAVAVAAAVLLAPAIVAAAALRRDGERPLPWEKQRVVSGLDSTTRQVELVLLRCPRATPSRVRQLLAHFGALLDIVQGRRCWFGVRPRRRGEWYGLSPVWQSLIGNAPVGLLNAPAWTAEDGTRLEAGAAADAFFVVRRSWRENLRIAIAALRRAVTA